MTNETNGMGRWENLRRKIKREKLEIYGIVLKKIAQR